MTGETPAPASNAGPETAAAFLGDKESMGIARECFRQLGNVEPYVGSGSITTAIDALAKTPSPRILLVDISGIADPLTQVRRLADVCDPSTSVVVVGDRNDVVLYRNMKDLGIVEYLFKPLTLDLTLRACRACRADPGAVASAVDGRKGKLVTIIGVRGGAGSTTVAVNMAWHFATQLSRDVALLDLDLAGGDAALQLDVAASDGLHEALAHPERIDDLFVTRAAIKVGPKLHLFAANEPLGNVQILDDQAIMKLLGHLQQRHRYVFVDAPVASGIHLDRLIAISGTIVLVAEPSLVAAREIGRWQDKIAGLRPAANICRVLNKAGEPGGLSTADFAAASGHRVTLAIPFDAGILRGANSGVPAIADSPALRRALGPLIQDLTGEIDSEPRSLLARVLGE